MTSENELFDHFAGPSSTNVFIWWVYLLLSLFIASSDLRRNKKTCNWRNASNSVSLDEPLLIASLFVTHRLTLWPCYRACLYVWKRVCSGGSRVGARGGLGPLLNFRPKWGPKGRKNFFLRRGPPYIGVWMTPPPLLMGPPLVCNVKFAAAPIYTSKWICPTYKRLLLWTGFYLRKCFHFLYPITCIWLRFALQYFMEDVTWVRSP